MIKLSTLLAMVLRLLLICKALGKKNLRFQFKDQQSERRKLTNIDCLLLIKTIHYETHETTVLDCHISGSLPLPIVNTPSWLNEKLQKGQINSNSDILKMSQALVSSEGIHIPSGGETLLINDGKRRRLVTSGEKSLIAMRVSVGGQSNPSFTSAEFSDSIFGTNGDKFNLVSGFASCSYNKLTFTTGIGQNVIDGMIDVNVGSLTNDHNTIWDAALKANNWSFDVKPPYDHVSTRNYIIRVL